MIKISEKQFVVGPVRLSYLNVFSPRKNNLSGKEEYSVTLLFPKGAAVTRDGVQLDEAVCADEIKQVQGACRSAAVAKFGSDFKGQWASPFKDGDRELRQEDSEPKHPGFWFLNARCDADKTPALIDGAKREAKVTDWESGDWGLVKVSFFGYDYQGKKGVGCGLLAVQFLYKDEPFGGGGGANADGFDTVANAAKPVPAGNVAGPGEYDPFADE